MNEENDDKNIDNVTNGSSQDSEDSSEDFSDINMQNNIGSLDDSFIIGSISIADLIVKNDDAPKTAPASLEIHHLDKKHNLIDKIKRNFKDKVKKQEHLNNFKIDDKIKDTINDHLKDKLNGNISNIVIESDGSHDSDILFEYDI